jgi:hypothetical protein
MVLLVLIVTMILLVPLQMLLLIKMQNDKKQGELGQTNVIRRKFAI